MIITQTLRRLVRGLLTLLLFSGLWATHSTQASPLIELTKEDARFTSKALSPSFEYLEDSDGNLEFAQVRNQTFTPIGNNRSANFGKTTSAYWVRFALQNHTDLSEFLIQSDWPLYDEISLYWIDKQQKVRQVLAGNSYPFDQREIKTPRFTFPILLLPGATQEYYIRVHTETSVQLPFRIWSPRALNQHNQLTNLLLGGYIAIVLSFGVYNFFIYLFTKDHSYIVYVVMVGLMALFQVSYLGYGSQYLWPESPWWARHSMPFVIGFLDAFVLFFGISFLQLGKHMPRWKNVLLGLAGLNILLAFASLVQVFLPLLLINVVILISLIALLFTSIYMAIKFGGFARYYLLSWVPFIVSICVVVFKNFGFIEYSSFMQYVGHAGNAAEILILSIALAERINFLKQEKQTAQQDLEKANQELLKADRIKDDFLAKVSHELRTPLHGIIGIAKSLKDRRAKADENEIKHSLELVEHSGERLTHLVNDILDFSQIQNQGLKLNFKPIGLASMVQVVFAHFNLQLRDQSIEIRCEIPQGFPLVMADEERLQQILFNLIGNATKFTHQGQIVVQAKLVGDKALVSIKDTGIGILEQDQARIFEPYSQAKGPIDQHSSGAGLGLALVKNLVGLHGGAIRVNSKIQQGSEFFFDLPLAQDQAQVESHAPSDAKIELQPKTKNPQAEPLDNDNPVILIVDDDATNREVIKLYLKARDYNLIEAVNGKDALKKVEARVPDLILLDIMMPLLSGLEACRILRRSYSASQLPIIFLTAKSQIKDLADGFALGGNDYIYKPFTKEELLPRMDNQLKGSSFRQRAESLDHLSGKLKAAENLQQVIQAAYEEVCQCLNYDEAILYQLNGAQKIQVEEQKQLLETIDLHQILDWTKKAPPVKALDHLSAQNKALQNGHLLIARIQNEPKRCFILWREAKSPYFAKGDVEYLEGVIRQLQQYLDSWQMVQAEPELQKTLQRISQKVDQIFYISSAPPYCYIHFNATQKDTVMIHTSLGKLVQTLMIENKLLQINRNCFIHPQWGNRIFKQGRGYQLELQDHQHQLQSFGISRKVMKDLEEHFPAWTEESVEIIPN